jgi:hypothetical protein
MPLSFDPASLMAPGGVVSGLDDLGAAVMNAMNRRAERRYATERETRHRGYSVEDRDLSRKNQLEDREAARKDRIADRVVGHLGRAADTYGPEMDDTEGEDLFSDINAAEDRGDITPAEANAMRARRQAAKGAYGAAQTKAEGKDIPARPIVPPTKTATVRAPDVDKDNYPTGTYSIVDRVRSFKERVAEAFADAKKLSMFKGRGADAQAQLEYAQSGVDTAQAVDNSAPWMPDDSPVTATAGAGVAAFETGESVPPENFAGALQDEVANQEAVASTFTATPEVRAKLLVRVEELRKSGMSEQEIARHLSKAIGPREAGMLLAQSPGRPAPAELQPPAKP